MAEIDRLEVKITANAQSATAALNSLSKALLKVKNALASVKDGVSVSERLSTSLNEMNGALNSISTTSIKKLQDLSNALNTYASAVKQIKGAGSVSKSIKDTQNALGTPSTKSSDATASGDSANASASGLKKLNEEVEKAGKKAKQSAGLFGSFLKSIGRIALYRAIRSALKAITEAFGEGLKNAYYYSQQTGDLSNLAKTLDEVKSKTQQMINQLGAFWGEIRQFVAPLLNWIAEKITKIAETLTELFAALNGDTYYQRAVYEELKWDEASDALKKYKQQLLGLDELNNLTQKENTKADDYKSHKNDYEDVLVRPEFQKIGQAWQGLKSEVEHFFEGWEDILLIGIGGLVLGSILMFTGHIFLGLGVILGSGFLVGKQIAENWDELNGTLQQKFEEYAGLIAAVAAVGAAIGLILLFVPGKRALGVTLLIASGLLGAADVAFNWDSLKRKIENVFTSYAGIIGAVAAVGAAIGMILLFIPGCRALGITLLLSSGLLGAADVKFNWDSILEKLKTAWAGIKTWFENNVVSSIKKFIKWVEEVLDINLTGSLPTNQKYESSLARSIRMNGGDYLGSELFNGEKPGLTSIPITVAPNTSKSNDIGSVNGMSYSILPSGGGRITTSGAMDVSTLVEAASAVQTPFKNFSSTTHNTKITIDNVSEAIRQGTLNGTLIKKKALGGIVNGSLFWAGESGPEFIGSMGGSSAVANTEQMTDAIYKAAYMGMSQALRENGGNGMSGYTPATGDDLFLIMRKKANAYNKMTGNPAFN